MTQTPNYLRSLMLPHGRAGRNELLLVAGFLLIVQFGFVALQFADFGIPEYLSYAIGGFLMWVGCTTTARRLHDVNRSGWWVPGGLAALCIWSVAVAFMAMMIFGVEAIRPNQTTYALILGFLFLPVLGAALWLHLAVGDPLPNRYGYPTEGERFVSSQASKPSSVAGAQTN
jgi:uncharacterized membrane protein YhaH (DUF805 family)